MNGGGPSAKAPRPRGRSGATAADWRRPGGRGADRRGRDLSGVETRACDLACSGRDCGGHAKGRSPGACAICCPGTLRAGARARALPTPVRSKINAADGQVYVWIPPCGFRWAVRRRRRLRARRDAGVHTVRIRSGFWLSRTEVTNAQYEKRMTLTPRSAWAPTTIRRSAWPGSMPRPTARDRRAAAHRGGSGNTPPALDHASGTTHALDHAWFETNSDDRSHPVGQGAQRVGLYDMLGNVYEWVLDRYHNQADDTTEEIEEPLPPIRRPWPAAAPGTRAKDSASATVSTCLGTTPTPTPASAAR